MVALFVPARIAGHSWVVVAQQPVAEAYAPIRRMAFQLALAVTVSVLMCLLATAVIRKMARSLQKEQQSLRRLLDLYERQRQIVAFEIHDGLSQHLAAALMTLEATARAPEGGSSPTQLAGGLQLLRDALAESRRLINGLHSTVLEDFGVVAAIDALVEDSRRRTGVTIDWDSDVRFDRLAAPLETAIYRVVQEGLTNALRHSGSQRVRIGLRQNDSQLSIEVEDFGKGFDPPTVGQGHFGLLGIRERARLLGGQARIETELDRGTRIVVELPVVQPSGETQSP
jgi:signal transduction histidine kinase